jgi:peroxiredoxin Q/BCP
MLRLSASFLALFGVVLGGTVPAACQEPADFLPVGEEAPDIQVTGATRHGVLADPVKLSDLRGETVVLAFFFRARTGG